MTLRRSIPACVFALAAVAPLAGAGTATAAQAENVTFTAYNRSVLVVTDPGDVVAVAAPGVEFADNAKWQLSARGEPTTIWNPSGNGCLQTDHGVLAPDAGLRIGPCQNAVPSKWVVRAVGEDGKYEVSPVEEPDLVVTLGTPTSTSEDRPIQLSVRADSAIEKWTVATFQG
ncbi:hypothetical protein [Actinosynnema sp. NPDC020468]|uniref:hypothetical protein n=1 Tax=Actinosynnema sp. NPDC020468 TaxID=3154488 RepID=UPI0033C189F6